MLLIYQTNYCLFCFIISFFLKGIDDSTLLNYIHEAGLDNLLERTGGLDNPVSWNWYV